MLGSRDRSKCPTPHHSIRNRMVLVWRDMRRAVACSDPVIGLSDAMLSNQLARLQSQYSGIYTGVILVGSFLVLYAMANTVTFTKGRKGGLNAILHGYRSKKDSKKNDRTYFVCVHYPSFLLAVRIILHY